VGLRVLFLVGLGALGSACGSGPHARVQQHGARWFYADAAGVSCELSLNRPGAGTYASCQSDRPLRAVTLEKDGRLEVCRGARCVGNAPESSVPLRPRQAVRLGPFSCELRARGIRCSAAPSGHGFLLGRDVLTRF
jgi:hypothetical protein